MPTSATSAWQRVPGCRIEERRVAMCRQAGRTAKERRRPCAVARTHSRGDSASHCTRQRALGSARKQLGGLSRFSSDENETVPFQVATVIDSPILSSRRGDLLVSGVPLDGPVRWIACTPPSPDSLQFPESAFPATERCEWPRSVPETCPPFPVKVWRSRGPYRSHDHGIDLRARCANREKEVEYTNAFPTERQRVLPPCPFGGSSANNS